MKLTIMQFSLAFTYFLSKQSSQYCFQNPSTDFISSLWQFHIHAIQPANQLCETEPTLEATSH
jgi:hypothetical protein